jgi:AraC-like DNA-binding protein
MSRRSFSGAPPGLRVDPVDPPEIGLTHAGENWWPAGQRMTRHRHTMWEWYLQIEGQSSWRSTQDKILLVPGDLLVVPPGFEHGMDEPTQQEHRFLYFGLHMERYTTDLPGLSQFFSPNTWTLVKQAGRMQLPIRQLLDQICRQDTMRLLMMRSALLLVLGEGVRLFAPSSVQSVSPKDSVMATVLKELHRSPQAEWSMEKLAELAGFSRSRFCQRFSSEFGISAHRYLLRLRLDLAAKLLSDPAMNVAEAAKRSGFASASHLARALRQHSGQKPSELRQGMSSQ